MVFISATLDGGATKTSSFTGPLINTRPAAQLPLYECFGNSSTRKSSQVRAVTPHTLPYSETHMRTLCLPITKETLRLQGLTKLDQLVSRVMYSPFRAQNRTDEWSNGCPAYWRTIERQITRQLVDDGEVFCNSTQSFNWLNAVDSLFLWIPNIIGRSFGCRWRRMGVPMRSWGRYPRRGTALRDAKIETRKCKIWQKKDKLPKTCSHKWVYLSSTSWKTQLGVCVVVKTRLSVGILGALRKGKKCTRKNYKSKTF